MPALDVIWGSSSNFFPSSVRCHRTIWSLEPLVQCGHSILAKCHMRKNRGVLRNLHCIWLPPLKCIWRPPLKVIWRSPLKVIWRPPLKIIWRPPLKIIGRQITLSCPKLLFQLCFVLLHSRATVVTRVSVVFFVFVDMGPYGRKQLETTSPLKVHNRFTPQNSCILPGRSLPKLYKDWRNFKFLKFFFHY